MFHRKGRPIEDFRGPWERPARQRPAGGGEDAAVPEQAVREETVNEGQPVSSFP
jgi:hypothetical protein